MLVGMLMPGAVAAVAAMMVAVHVPPPGCHSPANAAGMPSASTASEDARKDGCAVHDRFIAPSPFPSER